MTTETTPDAAATTLSQAESKWSARVEKLQAEVAALKLDKERLDWLDGQAWDGIHVEVWMKGNPDVTVDREAIVYTRDSEVRRGDTRAAIDTAMNKNKENR